MTRPSRPPRQPPGAAAEIGRPAEDAGAPGAGVAAEIVDDRPEGRIRQPVDLLRFVVACGGLAVLVGIGLVARRTAAGVESDVLGAGRRLTGPLLGVLGVAAAAAMALLVCAMAVEQVARRQYKLLVQAALTGGVCAGLVAAGNRLLRTSAAAQFASTLTTVAREVRGNPLDAYLAGLVAFATVLGNSGRRWSTWLGLAIGADVVDSLIARHTTVLAVLITLLVGYTVGVLVRYVAGIPSTRPSAADIAASLSAAGAPVRRMERADEPSGDTRRYAAVTPGGCRLDITVFDRDQEAAGALYRLYRRARLRGEVSRGAPLSMDHLVERQALMSYVVAAAGVPTPRLAACVAVRSEATALAFDHLDGDSLASLGDGVTDAQLSCVWRAVQRLHARRVTHRALTADRILLLGDGGVALLDPGSGDVAASDLAIRLDEAQLLAETGLLVGPDRAVAVALAEAGGAELARTAPLLQRIAMYRSTRAALRSRRHLLGALREKLLAAGPVAEPAPVQLQRVRLRSLVSLMAGVVAAYLLIGQLAKVDLASLLRSTNWWWAAGAAVLSAATYAAAALNLIGFVAERLRFARTVAAQLAASFVTLMVPAGAGGVAVNVRYLQREGVPPAAAAASVGVCQVVAFALHIVLLLVFAAITGSREGLHFRPPAWVYWVVAGLVVVAVVVALLPAGRRMLRARLTPTVSQVVPRLLQVAQRPASLAEGIGGALAVTAAYVLCLDVCVRAVGGALPFSEVAVVYLTGAALGSAAPTPGGLGAVEAALSAGLTAAGLDGGTAVSAMLLFRLLTFWVPVPVGWVAFKQLERRGAL